MARIFSGMQPTGDPHLGNLLGAISNWVATQADNTPTYSVVDLHSLTSVDAAEDLSHARSTLATWFLAAGLDPDQCTLFFQSDVAAHSQLAWFLQCRTSMGELSRMTQYKSKGRENDQARVGLFAYPVLMAADILLHDTEVVPVGEDQRQHVELCRDIAVRFNAMHGDVLTVPRHEIPSIGGRVMDLQAPDAKMSKSDGGRGTIFLTDSADVVRTKFRRAVTDSERAVRFDPVAKPGVSNLLSIVAAIRRDDPAVVAAEIATYAELKDAAATETADMLTPIQQRHAELCSDPGYVASVFQAGAEQARATAGATLDRCSAALGLQ